MFRQQLDVCHATWTEWISAPHLYPGLTPSTGEGSPGNPRGDPLVRHAGLFSQSARQKLGQPITGRGAKRRLDGTATQNNNTLSCFPLQIGTVFAGF